MYKKMSHEEYVKTVREQVVKTAKAMLRDEIRYLLGARKFDDLQREASVKDDYPDFSVFITIAFDSD
jgi:uncharacterized protein YbcI